MSLIVTGQILDVDGNTPLPGAQIYESLNPSNVATADASGNFTITAPLASSQLTISFPGYDPMTDTAANLQGQDWIAGSNATLVDTALQAVKNVAKQAKNAIAGPSLMSNMITALIILVLLKIFKFF